MESLGNQLDAMVIRCPPTNRLSPECREVAAKIPAAMTAGAELASGAEEVRHGRDVESEAREASNVCTHLLRLPAQHQPQSFCACTLPLFGNDARALQ